MTIPFYKKAMVFLPHALASLLTVGAAMTAARIGAAGWSIACGGLIAVASISGLVTLFGTIITALNVADNGWKKFVGVPECYYCDRDKKLLAEVMRDRDELREALATLRLE